MTLRQDADKIIKDALYAALPDTAVKKALKEIKFSSGKVVLVSVGKAAWQMAKAAWDEAGSRIDGGVVITKYDHSKGDIGNLSIFEAGHPVSDENSYKATEKAIEAVTGLSKNDNVLLLISGGGSALFEKPLVSEAENQSITKQLLKCGASIVEMNTLRKRLSAVKGGRFAQLCSPARVFTIVLSDIIGDPLDMIASGPAYPDSSTCQQAVEIATRYKLELSDKAMSLIKTETPKSLDNVTTFVTGSVKQLCASAMVSAKELGYEPVYDVHKLFENYKEEKSLYHLYRVESLIRHYKETGKFEYYFSKENFELAKDLKTNLNIEKHLPRLQEIFSYLVSLYKEEQP